MFDSGAFGYVDVLNKAADNSWLRSEVLTNNIANVDTPGYKRKDVSFEKYLNSALEALRIHIQHLIRELGMQTWIRYIHRYIRIIQRFHTGVTGIT